MRSIVFAVLFVAVLSGPQAFGAGVRSYTRAAPSSTSVSEDQASTLTLTLTDAAVRPIQVWVRASAKVDASGRVASAILRGPDAHLVKAGQRARVFSLASRSQMHQAQVTGVAMADDAVRATLALPNQLSDVGGRYLVEIVADRGEHLSVPNVAIIEEGVRHVVYVDAGSGQYQPRDVQTGAQGEQYTQILGGLTEGEQVVSIGSFFIDAEMKLKSPGSAGGMDHGTMPGMNHSAMGHGQ